MFYYQFAENAIRRLLSACRRLEGYMTGQIEDEENKDDSSNPYLRCSASCVSSLINSRFPYVATEVLCSEIRLIVETCVSSSN